MDLWKIFKKEPNKGKDKLLNTFQTQTVLKRTGFRYIKAMPLKGLGDLRGIIEELKKGTILILNIKQFLTRTGTLPIELKRAIEQLTFHVKTLKGEIGQLGNHYVLLTPDTTIKIWKGNSD